MRLHAILALALALTACASSYREPPPKPFAGTRWEVMLERESASTNPQAHPWFVFGDGLVEGFAGCNPVTGRYVQDSVGARSIAFGRLALGAAQRTCDSRAQIVQAHILEVLQSASSYLITGDIMKMTGSAGSISLRAAPGAVH